MRAEATTLAAYLEEIPDKWRPIVVKLRELVLENLRDGFDEVVNWGMLTYEVPLATSGKTYNGKPLMYVAIGAQKNHVGFYLSGLYCQPELMTQFQEAHAKSGVKLDMGKACMRIKKMDQILEPVLGNAIAAFDAKEYVEVAQR